MQGPMTRARKRQLNLEVSSFLSDTFHTFENRLLPNDVILLRNIGEGHKGLRGSGGGDDDQQGRPTRIRVCLGLQDQSALNWSPRTHPESVFDDPHMDGS